MLRALMNVAPPAVEAILGMLLRHLPTLFGNARRSRGFAARSLDLATTAPELERRRRLGSTGHLSGGDLTRGVARPRSPGSPARRPRRLGSPGGACPHRGRG